MTKLDNATLSLDALLSAGWEWPDATARVCSKFNLDVSELTESYDEAVRTGWVAWADAQEEEG